MEQWIAAQSTRTVPTPIYCSVPWCGYKRHHTSKLDLCRIHAQLIADGPALRLHLEQEAVVSLEPDGYREIHAPVTSPATYQFSLYPLTKTHPGLATEILWALQHQDRTGYPINIATTKALISSTQNFPDATQSFLTADTKAFASAKVIRTGNAWSMFRVVRARLLERYVPWSTEGDLLRSDLIPFGLLLTPSNRSGSKRSMAALDFRPIGLDWARQMAKLWILERSTTETSSTTLITHVARLCADLVVQSEATRLPLPTDVAVLNREHGKLLARAIAGMTLLNGKPMPNSSKRLLGSTLVGMINYARKNSDLFEQTSLSFTLDYHLLIPVEDKPGADGDDETGRAVPSPSSSTCSTNCPPSGC